MKIPEKENISIESSGEENASRSAYTYSVTFKINPIMRYMRDPN